MTPGQARASTYKVAILGAAGGIGQPLSLLIKMSPLVSDLRLYDIANVKGVAADLSHCNTPAQVICGSITSDVQSSIENLHYWSNRFTDLPQLPDQDRVPWNLLV